MSGQAQDLPLRGRMIASLVGTTTRVALPLAKARRLRLRSIREGEGLGLKTMSQPKVLRLARQYAT